jgi:hypothetical protein
VARHRTLRRRDSEAPLYQDAERQDLDLVKLANPPDPLRTVRDFKGDVQPRSLLEEPNQADITCQDVVPVDSVMEPALEADTAFRRGVA